MNLPSLVTTKAVAKLVVARSVSGVIVTIIHNNVPAAELSKAQKAQLYIGAYVVGSMVADHATTYVNNQIDSIANMVTEIRKDKTTK